MEKDFDFFSVERMDEIAVFRLKANPLIHAMNLLAKKPFLDYLDRISNSTQTKAIVLVAKREASDKKDTYNLIMSTLETGAAGNVPYPFTNSIFYTR